jgi:cytochrome P450
VSTLDSLPGPRTPGFVNTLEFAFAPRFFTQRHRKKYGRVFRSPAIQGDAIFTTDPEHIRRIFAADSDTFRVLAATSLRALFGRQSVLLTSGPTHRRQRKLLSPPLQGGRLRKFAATMQQLADRQVATLTPGHEFRALDLTTAFTLDVIVQTVFGVTAEAEASELRELLKTLIHHVPPSALFAPTLQQAWYPPWARYLTARNRFNRWLNAKIVARRKVPTPGDDVLSLLLEARFDDGTQMQDEEVHAQLITLLLAGHETTAIALASCMSRLARHPEVLATLARELETVSAGDDVQRLPYLSAVIDETLRIDPIVSDVARIPNADFALDTDLIVTPQQLLIVLIEGVHLDATLYPDPLRFRPERFLERKYAAHEFMPFGGGVRRCIGAAFSDMETKIMLSTLVRRASLALQSDRPERRVRRNITMGPQHGVPMRVRAVR